jgi:tRNA (mo5U34)-methyltransferase
MKFEVQHLEAAGSKPNGKARMQRENLEAKILGREWFYEFQLPSGKKTKSYLPNEIQPIHQTRERMMFNYLEPRVGDRWGELRCLDLACHEGYFALKLALHGCREVLGIDAREEHVTNAVLIRDLHGLKNLTFKCGNVLELTGTGLGEFDVVLMLGLLYHVPDIIGALRAVRTLTKGVCLIETQLAPELPAEIEWGRKELKKEIKGCFAVVDESQELAVGNREASLGSTSLVPSRDALAYLLPRLGFTDVEFLVPPSDAYEQLARGMRVMIAATVQRRVLEIAHP